MSNQSSIVHETTAEKVKVYRINSLTKYIYCIHHRPDPVGDVGRTQYVEMVNNALRVYNKDTGEPETDVLSFADFWADLPNCSTNHGDPIVIYDQFNDRWVLMRFKAGAAPYFLCFAVSTTDDAAGNYYLYSLDFGSTFPDYPKIAICTCWRDERLFCAVEHSLLTFS